MMSEYQTIQVRFDRQMCFLQLNRPQHDNGINETMILECHEVLAQCQETTTILVLEGLPEVFCLGADFSVFSAQESNAHDANNVTNNVTNDAHQYDPKQIYELWQALKYGPFVSIAHVRGKVNAGGVGFVSACDMVLSDETATFSLSELIFELFPAMVLPFLIRRIGQQKAHYMTLMTQPIDSQQALEWGLCDAREANSKALLRRHLLRLRHLSKTGIRDYKNYMRQLDQVIDDSKSLAIQTNSQLFSDPNRLKNIQRFQETGLFPWE